MIDLRFGHACGQVSRCSRTRSTTACKFNIPVGPGGGKEGEKEKKKEEKKEKKEKKKEEREKESSSAKNLSATTLSPPYTKSPASLALTSREAAALVVR